MISFYNSGITSTKQIAEKTGVSLLKVQRIFQNNNLGKRVKIIPESKRKEIAEYTKNNPRTNSEEIAKVFGVHKSAVIRAYNKYYGKRGMEAQKKIPEEKIQRIIEIYKTNPAAKYEDTKKELGVSGTVIKRVRRENNLGHLGFGHIIGRNNKKYKSEIQAALEEQELKQLISS